MKVGGRHYRTIWLDEKDPQVVWVIDQRRLPHEFETLPLTTVEDVYHAIADMTIRGAPLIGVAAAFGMYLAALHAQEGQLEEVLATAAAKLNHSRPTAVNLSWATKQQLAVVSRAADKSKACVVDALLKNASEIAESEIRISAAIGQFGLAIIQELAAHNRHAPINILTHCNAGWLCCVDIGTATAPIYAAHDAGIDLHVWVDETRPRNQGASLTAWELGQHGVPYTLITDNAGGHLMQNGMVDMVVVGTDRTTRCGDVANKIGTYLKALAAHANQVPFYVAAPSSSIDWTIASGKEIPIEQRGDDEVKYVQGWLNNQLQSVLIAPSNAKAANYGFDVTPAHLITGIITEKGVALPNEESLSSLFPEQRARVKA